MDHDVESLRRAAARAFDLLDREESRWLNRDDFINDFLEDQDENYRAPAQ